MTVRTIRTTAFQNSATHCMTIGRAAPGTIVLFGVSIHSAARASALPDGSELIAGAERSPHPFPILHAAISAALSDLPAAFNWAGPGAAWLGIILCSLILMALSVAIATLFRHLARRWFPFSREGLLRPLSMAVLVLSGLLLQFALPVTDRMRAMAAAIFVGCACVLILGLLCRAALRSGFSQRESGPMRLIWLGLSVSAFGYVLLGLMRLSGAASNGRATVALLLWMIVAGLSVGILRGLLRLRATPDSRAATLKEQLENPVMHLLSRNAGWFFGTVLGLIVLTTAARILRLDIPGFAGGVIALLLLGALPPIEAAVPKLLGGRAGSGPWRVLVVKTSVLAVFIGFWLLLAWMLGINLFTLAGDRLGARAVRMLIDIGIALVLGFMFWQLADTALKAVSQRGVAAPAAEAIHLHQPTSRIQTFAPLLRAIVLAFTIAATGMIILASMGVNIGPLLAGAGIFGIAIGFGSQALVKDVISGIFYLSDDAFRIGEFVEVGNAEGTVEALSIRSLKLRHPRGAIFTIPFGEIKTVNNQSRDWSLVKLEFLLDFRTDLPKAKRVVKQVSQELQSDPMLGAQFLEPLKFQGVKRMEPYGMVIGTKFTARPGEQYVLRREAYARLRDAFAASGIEFARPQVLVNTTSGRAVEPEALQAAASMAISMADETKK